MFYIRPIAGRRERVGVSSLAGGQTPTDRDASGFVQVTLVR
jgi:hypothetical protein